MAPSPEKSEQPCSTVGEEKKAPHVIAIEAALSALKKNIHDSNAALRVVTRLNLDSSRCYNELIKALAYNGSGLVYRGPTEAVAVAATAPAVTD